MLLAEGFRLCTSTWRGWIGLAIFWFAGWLVFGTLCIVGLKGIFSRWPRRFLAKGHRRTAAAFAADYAYCACFTVGFVIGFGLRDCSRRRCSIICSYGLFCSPDRPHLARQVFTGYFYAFWKAFQVWLMLMGESVFVAGLFGRPSARRFFTSRYCRPSSSCPSPSSPNPLYFSFIPIQAGRAAGDSRIKAGPENTAGNWPRAIGGGF